MFKKIHVGDFKIGQEEKEAVNKVLDSGRLSEGTNVSRFEQEWARFIGTKYATVTSSGFGALMVGLQALKIMKNLPNGAKVITTPLTYIATSSSISWANLEPIYVDVDPQTFSITAENVKKHLKQAKNVKEYAVVLPVHLMGYAADIDAIVEVAKEYGLSVFEDSAQAHGTIYKGKKLGSWGDLADFSFYIAHNIQAGEMGALVSDNPEIARLAKKLKAQGRACDCVVCTRAQNKCPKIETYEGDDDFDPRFTHDLIGFNFKAMEFQAALGLTQLHKADWILAKRRENVKYLNSKLKKYTEVFKLPVFDEAVSYLAYPIVIKKPELISRKRLRKMLEDWGVETRPLFGSIPTQQPAYAFLKEEYQGKLPNADHIGLNGFYIGCHQYLSQEDLEYIVKTFDEVMREI
ncbi:hypothetical protein CO181_00660 [candidate division WWE3 bacterium CG_4_9_14_3_um_filter_43_9]|uniref:Aminotransferase DegT n=1 Tax=candidate division WWE3 bacterium CG_4_9_14_3_um_filter_43_9 TaxID=1975082 RepID=A0A2M7WYN6_UNCKA|nr:MAG: hypothetical protein CO181_00660 [candidate division WWE3 bacterium CG_4_9_14_3_um_filter_43_9]